MAENHNLNKNEEEKKKRVKSSESNLALEKKGGDEDSNLWLLSYADLMTLIACFFILMVAFANFDPQTFDDKAEEVSKHFNRHKLAKVEDSMQKLAEEIHQNRRLKIQAEVKPTDQGLEITFKGSILFDSGSAKIKPEFLPTLDILINLIRDKGSDYRILVEGHTDNVPIKHPYYLSNWELSGARAASVVSRFEHFGHDPKKLVAIGFGETRPLLPNEDQNGEKIPENLQVNRRIVIKVLKPYGESTRLKIGLGAYFKNEEMLPNPIGSEEGGAGNSDAGMENDNLVPEGQMPEGIDLKK